jgi:predicted amidophosphoribosyltransferase
MCREVVKTVTGLISAVGKFFYRLVVLNIYDGYRSNSGNGIEGSDSSSIKIDSRKIAPPRFRNETEMIVLGNLGAEKNNIRFHQKLSGHPFTIKLDRRIKYILDYSMTEVHASIYWFKYRRDEYTINLLGRILWDEIIFEISDKLDFRQKINEWLVSPAPSTSFELGKKNWDHNKDLLYALENIIFKNYSRNESRELIKFSTTELFSINRTRQNLDMNKKLGRKDRLSESANKFILRENIMPTNNYGLIIFDDVATTGATLMELSGLAQKLKPKFTILISIAH